MSSIRLCAGEHTFRLSRQTLRSAGGMLEMMFGRFYDQGMTKPEEDGAYFIDADPEAFVEIVRYLRTGQSMVFHPGKWIFTRTQVERFTGLDVVVLDLGVNGISQELLKDYCRKIFPEIDTVRKTIGRLIEATSRQESFPGDKRWSFLRTEKNAELFVRADYMYTADLSWEPYRAIMLLLFAKDYRVSSFLECIAKLFEADDAFLCDMCIHTEHATKLKRKSIRFVYNLTEVEQEDS